MEWGGCASEHSLRVATPPRVPRAVVCVHLRVGKAKDLETLILYVYLETTYSILGRMMNKERHKVICLLKLSKANNIDRIYTL